MNQIIDPKPMAPMSSCTGVPRSSMRLGSMRDTAVPHHSAAVDSVMARP
jgi:hypothetical protein